MASRHGSDTNLLPGTTPRSSHHRPRRGVQCSIPTRPYSGKITAYDSPIYIADAALYLMTTQPDLGIENPYTLEAKN